MTFVGLADTKFDLVIWPVTLEYNMVLHYTKMYLWVKFCEDMSKRSWVMGENGLI